MWTAYTRAGNHDLRKTKHPKAMFELTRPPKGKCTYAFGKAMFIIPILILVGCASVQVAQVKTSHFKAPRLERELNFFVANYSSHETNRFYMGAIEINHGELASAWVYWKEERTLLPYVELMPDAPAWSDAEAWGANELKLDRDTVDTEEDIDGSTYLATHRQWVNWMEQCISKGKPYCVLMTNARKVFPKKMIDQQPLSISN